ncbi:MAG: cupin domain-containing protein [Magnetococcales bacterium]|nr:cupin domain-containing protein [Magnetococcales bacterium]
MRLPLWGVVLSVCSVAIFSAEAGEIYSGSREILKTESTVLGEKLSYPGGGPAEIRSLIIVIAPGEETKWHKHPVPLYAYVLSGTLTVDYGDKGKRTYQSGEAFMEAMDQWHRGQNDGKEPVQLVTVFLGGENRPISVPREESRP